MENSIVCRTANKKQVVSLFLIILIALTLTALVVVSVSNKADYIKARDVAIKNLEKDEGYYNPQRLVLENISQKDGNNFAEKLNASIRWSPDNSFAALVLPENTTIYDVCSDHSNKDYLSYITPDYYAKTCDVRPNPVVSPPSVSFNDTLFNNQTYLNYLNLTDVWNSTKGSGVTVAVIDTGIDTDHVEFFGRISEYSYNASEDKVVKDQPLINGEYDWSILEDEDGHGTAVAGTICAATNGTGTVGIAPEVNLIVIKCDVDANGQYNSSADLRIGVAYAVLQNADVINMSFGGVNSTNIFATQTQLAVNKNIICVAAAGNDATNETTYPCADPNVIGVGALADDSWDLASYSNYGINNDVVAPGTVFAPTLGGGYSCINGTSFASPITASAIALYLSYHGTTSYAEIRELLLASCYDLGKAGNDATFGYGAVDVTAFILEEKGTATFYPRNGDSAITKKFVRNHTLQAIPMPVWGDKYFSGWYYDTNYENALTYYSDIFTDDLSLYAKWSTALPIEYTFLEDNTVKILSFSGSQQEVSIPSIIDGRSVSCIGENAFQNNVFLTEITLPDTVLTICAHAFEGCSALTTVHLPASIMTIHSGAFMDCEYLTGVYYDGSMSSWCAIDFDDVTSNPLYFAHTLHINGSLSIPYTISEIKTATFAGWTTITSLTIPGNIKKIGPFAFSCCKNLSSLTIQEGVESIGTYAFQNCSSLQNISIPDSILNIDSSSFAGIPISCCNQYGNGLYLGNTTNPYLALISLRIRMLPSCVIHQNTKIMVSGVFFNTSITSIVIPDKVIRIESDTFANCSNLTSVTIGNGVTCIDSHAFGNCSNLTNIIIGNSTTSIKAYAFLGCNNLSKITISDIAAWCGITFENGTANPLCYSGDFYINDDLITEIVIPDAVTRIKKYAFYGWKGTSVTIFGNIDYIEQKAFNNCYYLQSFIFHDTLEAWNSIPKGSSWCDNPSAMNIVIHQCSLESITSATCTKAGWGNYTCSLCNHAIEKEIAPLGHDMVLHGAKAPTCLEKGWAEYGVCSRCEFSTYEEITALGHDIVAHNAKAPTCTEAGWDEYDTCSRCDYTTYAPIEAMGHDIIQYERKIPTCTEVGHNAYEACTRCDYTTYEEIASLGHDYSLVVTTPRTCTEQGYTTHTCSRCGDSYIDQRILAMGHNYKNGDATVVAPTCTQNGYTRHPCSRCSYYYDDNYTIALGHDLIHYDVKAATCTEIGWNEHDACSRCDYSTREEIAALGHDITIHPAQAPTCTEIGWYEYETCSRCDHSTLQAIAALGHVLNYHDSKTATCTEIGWDAYVTCSQCSHTTYKEKSAKGHLLTYHNGKAATCTEIGWNDYETCSRCDHTTYEETAALGHDIIHHAAQNPTCTEIGWDAYDACSRCDLSSRIDIPAIGHDMVHHNEKSPTCTEIGWDEYDACSRCDLSLRVDIPALGHILSYYESKEPTCTEIGWDEYETCSQCDHSTYNEITVLGHDYQSEIISPSCLEEGYTIHTCNRCRDVVIDDHTDALGHDLIHHEGKEATCTEMGWDEYNTCSRCDYSTYREYLGHEIIRCEGKAQACTEIGWSPYEKCLKCDYSTYEELPALGHILSYYDAKAPTCTDTGWNNYEICSRCNYSTYQEIAALGHDYDVIITPPTCTERGYTKYNCSRCSISYTDKYIEASGHVFGEWVNMRTPTASTEGIRKHVCEKCYSIETAIIELSEDGQQFVDNFNKINLQDMKLKSSNYNAICQAATSYYALSDEEKQWLSEDYKTLVDYAKQYNEIAESTNNDIDMATKNTFSLLSLISGILSAIWFALKDLF